MKSNLEKCNLLVSTNNIVLKLGQDIFEQKILKLLGIHFDSKLSFDCHLSEICKKATRKLDALGRITPYEHIKKKDFYGCLFQLEIQLFPSYMDTSQSHH